ncbi:hypothetical protein JDV02_008239 [Purpureocillium takamizusanense]|uniref:Hydrophobin n=1 Tax=Purpureocillium takamizusanense TaxID=2060973 RepID=A0A9Q8QMC5_9HYPO|nr:uncharacterized protein JDV02_008239 [Purpureocillium takamizusanense]UNI22343.1 hypothetical protein JDV02_008239 [Purpureocillium takamizusanense]
MKFTAVTVLASLAGALATPEQQQQVQALDRRGGGGICNGLFSTPACCDKQVDIFDKIAVGIDCAGGSSELLLFPLPSLRWHDRPMSRRLALITYIYACV